MEDPVLDGSVDEVAQRVGVGIGAQLSALLRHGHPPVERFYVGSDDLVKECLREVGGKYQVRAAGLAIAARVTGTVPSDPSARPEPWSDYAATADHAHVPSVVFTEPEIATIGLTSAAAENAGLPVRVIDYDLARSSWG